MAGNPIRRRGSIYAGKGFSLAYKFKHELMTFLIMFSLIYFCWNMYQSTPFRNSVLYLLIFEFVFIIKFFVYCSLLFFISIDDAYFHEILRKVSIWLLKILIFYILWENILKTFFLFFDFVINLVLGYGNRFQLLQYWSVRCVTDVSFLAFYLNIYF